MMFDGLGSSAAHIKGGRIKALAVASDKRAPGFADLPTSAEAGLASYQVATWYGMWAPKGTPKDIVERMQAEMQKVFTSDEMKSDVERHRRELPDLYGDAFGRFVSSEIKRWAEVVKARARSSTERPAPGCRRHDEQRQRVRGAARGVSRPTSTPSRSRPPTGPARRCSIRGATSSAAARCSPTCSRRWSCPPALAWPCRSTRASRR